MTVRRDRQLDELRELCRCGAVGRAIDLAFEHFAEFGRDDAVVALLTDSVDHRQVTDRVRRRLTELNGCPE